MIAKYIGSASEFSRAKYAMIVYSSTSSLNRRNLSTYTSSNKYFLATATVQTDIEYNADSNKNYRIAKFTKLDISKFIEDYNRAKKDSNDPINASVNFIILLDMYSDPVGYVDLTQTIDLIKYGIQTIKLIFNFKIIVNGNGYIELNLDTIYTKHISDSSSHKAHNSQFNRKDEFKVLSRDEILDFSKSNFQSAPEFIHDVDQVEQLPKSIYHYSGKLNKGLDSYGIFRFKIRYQDFNNTAFFDIIKYNNCYFIILCNSYQTTVYAFDSEGELLRRVVINSMIIKSSNNIGSNLFIIPTQIEETHVYSTKELFDVILDNDLNDKVDLGSLVLPLHIQHLHYKGKDDAVSSIGFKYCKNPFTKELYPYYFTSDKVYKGCNELYNILSQFNLLNSKDRYINSLSESILFAANNLVCTGFTGSSNYSNYIRSLNIFNSWRVSYRNVKNSVESISDSTPLWTNDKNIGCIYDKTFIKGIEISDIIFLTPELLYIEDYNRDPTGGLNPICYQYAPELKIDNPDQMKVYQGSNLSGGLYYDNSYAYLIDSDASRHLIEMKPGTRIPESFQLKSNGCRNYHLIAKQIDPELRKLTPIRMELDGSLFGYRLDGDEVILRKL